jgi:hypothetical protein
MTALGRFCLFLFIFGFHVASRHFGVRRLDAALEHGGLTPFRKTHFLRGVKSPQGKRRRAAALQMNTLKSALRAPPCGESRLKPENRSKTPIPGRFLRFMIIFRQNRLQKCHFLAVFALFRPCAATFLRIRLYPDVSPPAQSRTRAQIHTHRRFSCRLSAQDLRR